MQGLGGDITLFDQDGEFVPTWKPAQKFATNFLGGNVFGPAVKSERTHETQTVPSVDVCLAQS